MTKIYIAGPMSGLVDFNFPAFHKMAASFRAQGFEVVNPAEINQDISTSWVSCLRADIRELVTCDAIVTTEQLHQIIDKEWIKVSENGAAMRIALAVEKQLREVNS